MTRQTQFVLAGLALVLATADTINSRARKASAAITTAQTEEHAGAQTAVTYWQLYPTADGETHFREVRVALTESQSAPPARPYGESARHPATSTRYAAFAAHWGASDRDHNVFHNATARRFISVSRGVAWIKASNGETRQFHPGDIFEVLDVAPSKGHILWVGDSAYVVFFSDHP
jgi:hypothetical protein